MGGYNLSCALSKIDIISQDSVMVYPLIYAPRFTKAEILVGQEEKSVGPINLENIGVNALSKHLLPFEAVYNDYCLFEGEDYNAIFSPAKNFLEFLLENPITDKKYANMKGLHKI